MPVIGSHARPPIDHAWVRTPPPDATPLSLPPFMLSAEKHLTPSMEYLTDKETIHPSSISTHYHLYLSCFHLCTCICMHIITIFTVLFCICIFTPAIPFHSFPSFLPFFLAFSLFSFYSGSRSAVLLPPPSQRPISHDVYLCLFILSVFISCFLFSSSHLLFRKRLLKLLLSVYSLYTCCLCTVLFPH